MNSDPTRRVPVQPPRASPGEPRRAPESEPPAGTREPGREPASEPRSPLPGPAWPVRLTSAPVDLSALTPPMPGNRPRPRPVTGNPAVTRRSVPVSPVPGTRQERPDRPEETARYANRGRAEQDQSRVSVTPMFRVSRARVCESCGGPIPETARPNKKTCSNACRMRLSRLNKTKQMVRNAARQVPKAKSEKQSVTRRYFGKG